MKRWTAVRTGAVRTGARDDHRRAGALRHTHVPTTETP